MGSRTHDYTCPNHACENYLVYINGFGLDDYSPDGGCPTCRTRLVYDLNYELAEREHSCQNSCCSQYLQNKQVSHPNKCEHCGQPLLPQNRPYTL